MHAFIHATPAMVINASVPQTVTFYVFIWFMAVDSLPSDVCMAGCGHERGRVLALVKEQLDTIEEKVRLPLAEFQIRCTVTVHVSARVLSF